MLMIISLIIGAILGILPTIAHFPFYLSAFIIPFFLLLKKRYPNIIYQILLSILGILLGILFSASCRFFDQKDILSPSFFAKPAIISGKIVSIPEKKSEHQKEVTSFIFSITKINNLAIHQKAALRFYGNDYHFQPGDTWQFSAKIKPAHQNKNFDIFLNNNFYQINHIKYVGYISKSPQNILKSKAPWKNPILFLRYKIHEKIEKSSIKNKGILTAITIGSYSDMDKSDFDLLRKTGTVHLVAIAGLHIGFLISLIYALANFFFRLFGSNSRQTRQSFALKISAIFGFLYATISGFSLPAIRVSIMSALFLYSYFRKKNYSIYLLFWTTMLLTLLLNPYVALSIGFYLSFTSVFFLIFAFHNRYKINFKPRTNFFYRIFSFFKIQLIITSSIFPFLIYYFQSFEISSIIANLFVIPLFGYLILPLGLLGVFLSFINQFLSHIALFGFDYLTMKLMKILAFFNLLEFHLAVSNMLLVFLYLLGLFFLFLPAGAPFKKNALFLMLPVFFFNEYDVPQNTATFNLFNVGQGLASIFITKNFVTIYDTGGKSENFDAGENIIARFLRNHKIKTINLLVVSHGDNDHIGGADYLLKNFRVKKVLTSVPEKFTQYSRTIVQKCTDRIHFISPDGVFYVFLHPQENSSFLGNNASCVLKISTPEISFLLTGDIEKEAEREILKKHEKELKSTILISPHHGSDTSSTDKFIEKVAPRIVLIPNGFMNKFHFPKAKVLETYQKYHAKIYSTANDGAISLKIRLLP